MSECAVRVFGVQPLAFAVDHGQLLRPASAPAAVDAASEQPSWVAELEGLYPHHHFHYRCLECAASVDIDGRRHVLSAWLASNVVLNQHVVIFELQAGVYAQAAIDVGALRALLVATADDRRPPVVTALLGRACEAVAASVGCRPHELVVRPDTCNVTLFLEPRVDGQAMALLPPPATTACFVHDAAERLTVARTAVEVSTATRVFLGGRAHIVVSTSRNDVNVIRQIMFMLQVTWFFVPLYLRHAAGLHRQLQRGRATLGLDELEAAAGDLVYVYQTVRLQNESAKISWESLAALVHRPVASAWAIEGSIDQLQRYAEFFQAFIKDVREVQSRRADEVLNYVLAALALFGLVGLWANVLGAEAAVRDIGSWSRLIGTATGSALGLTTVVVMVASALIAAGLISYGIRARHGRRRRRGQSHEA